MTKDNVEMMVLNARFQLLRTLFVEIKGTVSGAVEVLADIGHTGTLRAETLYTSLWDDYSNYQRQLIGSCVAYMVKNGMLELKMAGSPKTKPKRYRIKY